MCIQSILALLAARLVELLLGQRRPNRARFSVACAALSVRCLRLRACLRLITLGTRSLRTPAMRHSLVWIWRPTMTACVSRRTRAHPMLETIDRDGRVTG